MRSARMKVFVILVPILFAAGAMMAQTPPFQPVGTLHELMLGIVKPTSDVIFKFQYDPPKTDAEWALVQNAALMLGETGNLLLMPGRAKDTGDWTKYSKALVDAGSAAFKAAIAKDGKALGDAATRSTTPVKGATENISPSPPNKCQRDVGLVPVGPGSVTIQAPQDCPHS